MKTFFKLAWGCGERVLFENFRKIIEKLLKLDKINKRATFNEEFN